MSAAGRQQSILYCCHARARSFQWDNPEFFRSGIDCRKFRYHTGHEVAAESRRITVLPRHYRPGRRHPDAPARPAPARFSPACHAYFWGSACIPGPRVVCGRTASSPRPGRIASCGTLSTWPTP